MQENFVHGMHPPVYYFLISVYRQLGGGSMIALRLSSIFFGFLTLVIFDQILRRTSLDRKWLALLALNPGFLFFSREATYYSFHILIAVLLLYTYLHALSSRKTAAFTVVCLLAIYSYYYHLFLIAALFIDAMIVRRVNFKRPLILILLFSIPLFSVILSNPFLHGIASGKSIGLTATKPAINIFDPELSFQYLLYTPAYLFLMGERYLWLNWTLALPFTVLIYFLMFRKGSGRNLLPLYLIPFILLAVFSEITKARIQRISFFPYHLLPYLPVMLLTLALNLKNSRLAAPFLLSALFMCGLQDLDQFFNPWKIYQNKDELRQLAGIAASRFNQSKDLIFANYSYEWNLITFADQIRIVAPDLPVASLERYSESGDSLFESKNRILEFGLTWLDKSSIRVNTDDSGETLKDLRLTGQAEEFLARNYNLSEKIVLYGEEGSNYCLKIWERFAF
ncbi:MAG: glycosyltransferase family 39 protein [Candidatus Wallbacteria bacterium]|nr:glycosyltransferase family 39 protein [Candidatus Wallbacteria bacterium]